MSDPAVNDGPDDGPEPAADTTSLPTPTPTPPVEDEKPSDDAVAAVASAEEQSAVFSEESYVCDRQYAIVLAQLMAVKEREKVYRWIDKLDSMTKDSTPDDLEDTRHERDRYLRFLILSLSNGKLMPPFSKEPTPGLRPLSLVAPKAAYKMVVGDKCDGRPRRSADGDGANKTYYAPEEVEPRMFLSRQPSPSGNGGIVYAAAFSDVAK